MTETCDLAPAGWWCSREPGHEDPCAARRVPAIVARGDTLTLTIGRMFDDAIRIFDEGGDEIAIFLGVDRVVLTSGPWPPRPAPRHELRTLVVPGVAFATIFLVVVLLLSHVLTGRP